MWGGGGGGKPLLAQMIVYIFIQSEVGRRTLSRTSQTLDPRPQGPNPNFTGVVG